MSNEPRLNGDVIVERCGVGCPSKDGMACTYPDGLGLDGMIPIRLIRRDEIFPNDCPLPPADAKLKSKDIMVINLRDGDCLVLYSGKEMKADVILETKKRLVQTLSEWLDVNLVKVVILQDLKLGGVIRRDEGKKK